MKEAMEDKKNLLAKILYEAKSYNNFEDIEKLVEKGLDLSNLPLQPLYVSLLNAPTEQIASVLPKFSKEQRQALLDLDLWSKDTVDVFSFEYWLEAYSKCREDSIVKEFVQSEDFLLYLKSRVNIHTFDTEDPQYPDHDNYFLTDDMLLLVEYSDSYPYSSELKYFIRHLYDTMGVENAYSVLFKMINESFSLLQETEYNNKRERLREYGFVDYFEAKESLHPFLSLKGLERFVLNKTKTVARVGSKARNQSLHSSALVQFERDMENILQELAKVKSDERKNYLHFNFVRLVNSSIVLKDALRGGRVELGKIGKSVKAALDLGLQYAADKREYGEEESIFDYFDFGEIYKIGATLWDVTRRKISKAAKGAGFVEDKDKAFMGTWWNSFIEGSFEEPPAVKSFGVGLHPQKSDNLKTWSFWREQALTFSSLAPFMGEFYKAFKKLKGESKLNDQFYLNYSVEDIDFESLILSSFINRVLGNFDSGNANKMGLAVAELREFFKFGFELSKGEYVLKPMEDPQLRDELAGFKEAFGMQEVANFENYLYGLLYEHLSGYEFDTLGDEDFAHVGGPVILNTLTKN